VVSDQREIGNDHVATWRDQGYVAIEDFISPDEVAVARAEASNHFPTGAQVQSRPDEFAELIAGKFNWSDFPYQGELLNRLCVRPDILRAVANITGTDDSLLATSILWAKYGGTADYDQELHVDYRNNTLLHPSDEGPYAQVPFILYLTDVGPDQGPTYMVPRSLTSTDPVELAGGNLSRADHPQLYEREIPVTVKAGTLVMYSMRTYHRGSAMRDPLGYRLSMHFVYRGSAMNFAGWRAWGKEGANPLMIKLLESLTPETRRPFGFPPPGHPYWTRETVAGVGARYPNMDMSPYDEALVATPTRR
jgi:ectoine hydroxylase-related dioxygenase (phytanoyl-CoA dioxygenase family)